MREGEGCQAYDDRYGEYEERKDSDATVYPWYEWGQVDEE